MKTEIRNIKLNKIKLNPDNPRRISEVDMKRLIISLKEFPDMMNIREIVCDETMTVLGGNMRLQALRKIGAKNCMAKIVTGLTPAQKREFVIKDNTAFGEFDFDILANTWDNLPLADWGVSLPENWLTKQDESLNAGFQSNLYSLEFKFLKDDAAFVMEQLHRDRENNLEQMDEYWRQRCLLRLLKKTI
ncbi:MAG: hypothetical protein QME78_13120 [Thermodesulfobacteriota bacterium]|nr:hypothetical protein [Thermodesulfobacteriota bacterium]